MIRKRPTQVATRHSISLALIGATAALAAFIASLQHSPLAWLALAVAGTATITWLARQWRAKRRAPPLAALASDEALLALDRLTTNAAPDLPASVRSMLETLRLQLRGLLREAASRGHAASALPAEDAATIEQTIKRYLPDALRHFLALPARSRGSSDEAELLAQLQGLRSQLAAIETRLVSQRRLQLSLHGRFLQRRAGRGSDD